MNESFLHYIWQFQYFNKVDLAASNGEKITVLKPGYHNTNAGPDFLQSKIKIESIEWIGHVELHIKSSEWYNHKHGLDGAYENVILHVVWENDKPVYRKDNTLLPTLELKGRVDTSLIQSYRKLVDSSFEIACEKNFNSIDPIIHLSMLDKALMQRLESKSKFVSMLLEENRGDWEETCYQWLSKAFGFKTNSDAFFDLSKSLPFKIIQKQKSLQQKEALMFGVAGMLSTKTKNEYITALYNEYQFLQKKYKLEDAELNPAQWKFLRLRPANFPTVRIAQLVSILHEQKNIFSRLTETENVDELVAIFSTSQSTYWQEHYRFGKPAKGKVPSLGISSIENLIINAVAPLLVAYGKEKDETIYVDRAVGLLQQLPGERNKITRLWDHLGLKIKTAFDSQAGIELYNNFCKKRQCLNCSIGVALLKPNA
jgi:hypothetical protein